MTFASIERARQVYEMPAVYSLSPGVVSPPGGDTRPMSATAKPTGCCCGQSFGRAEHARDWQGGYSFEGATPDGYHL